MQSCSEVFLYITWPARHWVCGRLTTENTPQNVRKFTLVGGGGIFLFQNTSCTPDSKWSMFIYVLSFGLSWLIKYFQWPTSYQGRWKLTANFKTVSWYIAVFPSYRYTGFWGKGTAPVFCRSVNFDLKKDKIKLALPNQQTFAKTLRNILLPLLQKNESSYFWNRGLSMTWKFGAMKLCQNMKIRSFWQKWTVNHQLNNISSFSTK